MDVRYKLSLIQASVAIAIIVSLTGALLSNHIAGDAYVAVISTILGYAFGNFKSALSGRATDKGVTTP